MADACGHTNPAGARFCLECGAALAPRCGQCRAELPPDARFCVECGTRLGAPAAPTESEGGERRQLTVLFCDLVGSTELSGRLDPEEWRDLVRAYQAAASAVVEKHGGHVAQYLGDGVLVYFGYPVALEDEAGRAVGAGLGIVAAIRSLGQRLKVALEIDLAVRIGIHTGVVVVGEVGGGARREHLALGDTPNIAARLQSIAAPNTVVVSSETQRLIARTFDMRQ